MTSSNIWRNWSPSADTAYPLEAPGVPRGDRAMSLSRAMRFDKAAGDWNAGQEAAAAPRLRPASSAIASARTVFAHQAVHRRPQKLRGQARPCQYFTGGSIDSNSAHTQGHRLAHNERTLLAIRIAASSYQTKHNHLISGNIKKTYIAIGHILAPGSLDRLMHYRDNMFIQALTPRPAWQSANPETSGS